MVGQILDFIHNYFYEEPIEGHFRITDGVFDPPLHGVKNKQYLKVEGSSLNDGIYQYPVTGLVHEEFDGVVWKLAVPRDLLNIAGEIEEWLAANNVAAGPFTSESFGGYSYTKGVSAKTGAPLSWQDVFASRLNKWRKII